MAAPILIAAALIEDGAGRLFLVRKRGTRAFMQAGGKIDPGETPLQALGRELGEELGIAPAPAALRPLGILRAEAAHEPDRRVEAHLFHLVADGEAFRIGAELEEGIWVTADQAKALPLAPLTRDHVLPLADAIAGRSAAGNLSLSTLSSLADGAPRSPAIDAAREFLAVVWQGDRPSDEALLAALDRLVAAYHDTPDADPSDTDSEAPRQDGASLYREVALRFPGYGLYPEGDPGEPDAPAATMADAIDDLADLTLDMREVLWLADHAGADDAHWSFRLHFGHWGRHARTLSRYLHDRLW